MTSVPAPASVSSAALHLTIGVVGTGAMGRGIMQWAAEAGWVVLAFDSREGAAREATAFVGDILARSVQKGRITAEQLQQTLGRINVVEALADLGRADVVIEAIVEDLKIKQALLHDLESVLNEQAILCTNTSSLSVTSCAKLCRRADRVAGLHFFNPAPVMRVVEIVKGEHTTLATIERLSQMVAKTKHYAVICADSPGFVVNHAGRGLYTEGLRIVQDGIATFSDVDKVTRDCLGFPMGPFELFDLTGLDVSSRVLKEIYESFFQEPRYRPIPLVYRRVEAGLFGRKVGQGFYKYENGQKIEAPEPAVPEFTDRAVHVAIASSTDRDRVSSLLASGGLRFTETAADAAAIVVAPLGEDATTAAMAGKLDARRVVAFDALPATSFQPGGRVTLMTTPITDVAARNCIHAALVRTGSRVTVINDSPGFIAQRMIANIVNTGCEIAQQRIASPRDIEEGVKRGLGYPVGPLSLGDQIGPDRVVSILAHLQARTGDPRYRASLWLKRRAELNVSLTTPE